jgi:translation initiation factor 2B subunit (eIF-2B alpha/beta/delta family)
MKKVPTMQQDKTLLEKTVGEINVARTVVNYLDKSANQLDTKTVGKLDQARERAVSALAARKQTASASSANGGNVLSHLGDYIEHHRPMMSVALILGALLVVFVLSQKFSAQNKTEQGDAFVLASELPPEAYLDKGFDVWLKRNSQH